MIKRGRICCCYGPVLSCTTIFVTIEGSIGGGSWYFRSSPRGGLGNFILIAREGHIIFNVQFKISPPPLLNSDKSLITA